MIRWIQKGWAYRSNTNAKKLFNYTDEYNSDLNTLWLDKEPTVQGICSYTIPEEYTIYIKNIYNN